MNVRIGTRANRHLVEIARFIHEHDVGASIRVRIRIQETFAALSAFPHLGRKGKVAGTREILVAHLPFIVVYRARQDMVVILGIYHCAQIRPNRK